MFEASAAFFLDPFGKITNKVLFTKWAFFKKRNRKKGIQESLQEVSDTADKVLERMTEMDMTMSRMDVKISEIKMLCNVITLFLNGLLAMAVLIVK